MIDNPKNNNDKETYSLPPSDSELSINASSYFDRERILARSPKDEDHEILFHRSVKKIFLVVSIVISISLIVYLTINKMRSNK